MCGAVTNGKGTRPDHDHQGVSHRRPAAVPSPLPGLTNQRFWLRAVLTTHYQSLPAAVLNTHTMISSIILYLLIVAGLAWASYLRSQFKR